MNLENVRDWLLDAAAFGKNLTPEVMEHAAGKISEGLRIFLEDTAHLADPGAGEALGSSKSAEGLGRPRVPPHSSR